MPYSNITITTDLNLSYEQYDFIQVAHDENNYIIGRVVSYNKTSGQLIFTPIKVEGSGSFSTWQISLTGDPGDTGEIFESGTENQVALFAGDNPRILKGDSNFTFDGSTLTIAPYQYSTGGNPIYRIVYHNDGTAGTAGIVVRGVVPGQPYDGIIENRVPHDYQHQFVVGSNNIAHIDAQGLHIQQSLIADNGVYLEGLESDPSQTRFLVWDPSTSGDGLSGKVKWTTAGLTGAQGPAGTPGSSGSSGTSGTSGEAGTSGESGTSGTSGESGTSGTSGNTGSSGVSGVDGAVSLRWTLQDTSGANPSGATYFTACCNSGLLNTGSFKFAYGSTTIASEGFWDTISAAISNGLIPYLQITQSNNRNVVGLYEISSVTYSDPGNLGQYNVTANGVPAVYANGLWSSGEEYAVSFTISGNAGSAGTSGETGTSGTSGESGASGTSGESGTSGTSGSGFVWQGAWQSIPATYIGGRDIVSYNGGSYIKIGDGNSGSAPPDDPVRWSPVAEPGSSGSSGLTGTSGTSGETGTSGTSGNTGTSGSSGTSGESGETGASGTSGTSGASGEGFNWVGGWMESGGLSTTPYGLNDVVYYNGRSYVSVASNIPIGSVAPDISADWDIMASDGAAGTAGTSGSSNGSSGTSGTSGNSGASGSSGTSGNSGSSGTSGNSGAAGSSGTSGTSFSSPYSGNLNGTSGQSWMSSYSATTTIDWNNSNVQTRTLASSETFTFSNPQNGATYILVIKQAAAGNYTITWPSINWMGGSPPVMTATANKTDIYTFVYANSTYYGSYAQNF